MAIAATGGGSGSTTVAATSKALSTFTFTTGRTIIVAVFLDDTTKTVTSIGSARGNTYTFRAGANGTGIRVELWTGAGGTTGTETVTINTSGSCNIAGAAEEYSGISSLGTTYNTATGSSVFVRIDGATQESGNFVVGGLGFACVSGDTLTAQAGTSRQVSIPAATAAAAALYDQTQNITALSLATMSRISTSRNWASASIELRSGGSAVTVVMPEMVAGVPVLEAGVVIY